MVDRSLRGSVLHWYRLCLRSARTWPGPAVEKTYIKNEALKGFRAARRESDEAEIMKKVTELQQRYEVAWHYLIPYPRLHHAKQGMRKDIPIMDHGSARDR